MKYEPDSEGIQDLQEWRSCYPEQCFVPLSVLLYRMIANQYVAGNSKLRDITAISSPPSMRHTSRPFLAGSLPGTRLPTVSHISTSDLPDLESRSCGRRCWRGTAKALRLEHRMIPNLAQAKYGLGERHREGECTLGPGPLFVEEGGGSFQPEGGWTRC